MEKRVLLAIFLSFLVLYIYQSYIVKPNAPVARPKPAETGQAAAQKPTPQPAAPAPGAEQAPSAPPAATVIGEQSERDIVVETAVVRAVFTNRGAELKSWELRR